MFTSDSFSSLPLNIDHTWTLFLDRDGVINRKLEGDYVKHWGEFEFAEKAIDALAILSRPFTRIILVTNQQGIGKGLMTAQDLDLIHQYMLAEIQNAEGRIDKIFFCPHLSTADHPPCRKPHPGMAWQAKAIFPQIDFSRSIMVGDATTDLEFGKALGMYTVWVSDTSPTPEHLQLIDLQVRSLFEFSQYYS